METNKNVIENMMLVYIDHKKILNEYESEMDERIKAYDVKMTKSYNNLLEEFGAIRAGRASIGRES